ncbi:hypothetical protein [Hyphomicrobium sp.]|uniref:hypothetical protein n=1 Tax=Hyphomicrobium sp. TaxID=82 RepID=UPI001D39C6B7|nr:hypothetical protein [Hyphomicrobium sp.]MBY0559343.1 hypothetical protein [Hyphomicrobium sp.]
MLLITSVPPVFSRKDRKTGEEIGTRYLKSCIDSWRNNGFRPLSINRLDEVDAINRLGLIDCCGVSNDAAHFPNRFGPSLGALLDVVPPTEPVAIVNSDIYMLSVEGCADFLAQHSQDSIVAARRIDVADHGASRGTIFELGYDLVAFTPAKIPKTISSDRIRRFQLGAPWWDYVFPYSCSEEMPAFRIREPFLTHLLHPDRWDSDVWEKSAVRARDACPSVQNDAMRAAVGSAQLGPAIALGFNEALFGARFCEIEAPPFRSDSVYRSRPLAINPVSQLRLAQSGSRDWDFQSLIESAFGNTKVPASGKRDPIGRKIRRAIKSTILLRSQSR